MQVLDFVAVKKEVSFPIRRERLKSDPAALDPIKDAVIVESTNKILGVIPRKTDVLLYPDLMDWLANAFTELNLPFNIRESKLTNDGAHLHQEWIVNVDNINDPDGKKMLPTVFMHTGYIGGSTKLEFGTFRLVCSNGAKVGQVITRIVVKPQQSVLTSSIKDDMKMSLDKFARVSDLYKGLNDKEMNPILFKVFMEELFSFEYKKEVIEFMVSDKTIAVSEKYTKNDLLIHPETIVMIQKMQNAWYLYNVLTAVATHKLRTVSARYSTYKNISELFGI